MSTPLVVLRGTVSEVGREGSGFHAILSESRGSGFVASISLDIKQALACHLYRRVRIEVYRDEEQLQEPAKRTVEALRNLAGVHGADSVLTEELSACRIQVVPAPTHQDEVPYTLQGKLECRGYVVTLTRAPLYWRVRCEPSLLLRDAERLDREPYDGPAGAYSGSTGTLGDVVRAYGFAGGQRPDTDVGSWHIDTVAGLFAFVRWFRSQASQVQS